MTGREGSHRIVPAPRARAGARDPAGEVENVLLDPGENRILGLDILCGDGANRFLPYSTARVDGDGIEIESTLTMLDRRELEFYREHGRPLAAVPELADAVVEPDGGLVVGLPGRC